MKTNLLAAILLFWSVAAKAQSPDHIYFTKGAELEYRNYSSRPAGFTKLELYEVTRIKLTVTDVKDSNGVKYSFITKTGTSVNMPRVNFYERKFVLRQENNLIRIPKDLITPDTVYMCDRYPEAQEKETWYAVTKMKTSNDLVIDLLKEQSGEIKLSAESEEVDVFTKEFMISSPNQKRKPGEVEVFYGGTRGTLHNRDYTMQISDMKMTNEGQTKIKTPAGNFTCYKLSSSSKVKMKGAGVLSLAKINASSVVYYAPGIGILKTEDESGKQQTGYVELYKIKK